MVNKPSKLFLGLNLLVIMMQGLRIICFKYNCSGYTFFLSS